LIDANQRAVVRLLGFGWRSGVTASQTSTLIGDAPPERLAVLKGRAFAGGADGADRRHSFEISLPVHRLQPAQAPLSA